MPLAYKYIPWTINPFIRLAGERYSESIITAITPVIFIHPAPQTQILGVERRMVSCYLTAPIRTLPPHVCLFFVDHFPNDFVGG